MSFFKDHTKKKICILLAHPDQGATNCGELALLYEASAQAAGHEVRRINLGDLHFDPILHLGYKTIQELEPDLKNFQDTVRWCEHLVIFYPNWWGTMPALLKGLFDRSWLPGFAFRMRKRKDGTQKLFWDKLLRGRTARVVVLSGTHPLLIWLNFGDYTNEIGRSILWFAGFKVKFSRMGPSEKAPQWLWNTWRSRIARLGSRGE